jgi:hypothetical protein
MIAYLSISSLLSLIRNFALVYSTPQSLLLDCSIHRHIPFHILPSSLLSTHPVNNFLLWFFSFVTTILLSNQFHLSRPKSMAGAQPRAQAVPPPPNKWQCHICHGGPHLYANTTRCTNIRSNNLPCNHDFCHTLCKKDNEIPPPLSSPQSSLPGLRIAPNPIRSDMPRTPLGCSANFASHEQRNRQNGPSAHPHAGNPCETAQTRRFALLKNKAGCRSRPSPAGWWRCCCCSHLNNPAFNTGRCSLCPHPGPCRWCIQY